jgi:hypothetical protein
MNPLIFVCLAVVVALIVGVTLVMRKRRAR